jgi:hypothetical protein
MRRNTLLALDGLVFPRGQAYAYEEHKQDEQDRSEPIVPIHMKVTEVCGKGALVVMASTASNVAEHFVSSLPSCR